MIFTEKQIELFWSHVDKSGDCWNWTAKHTRDGYGSVRRSPKNYSAHRMAYQISTGENPAGFIVMHKCDNKSCCNPAHLQKGTPSDNMQDMIRKGRQAKSFTHKRCMTHEKAEQLRRDFVSVGNKHELSRKYNIACRTVSQIINREIWK